MNEKNLKAWTYFLKFQGETPADTAKTVSCMQSVNDEQAWLELRGRLLKGEALPLDASMNAAYLMLLDHQEQPSLILKAEADGFYVESDIEAYVPEADMPKLIEKGRQFMKANMVHEFASDQMMKLPQPPLCKAAVKPLIPLSKAFSELPIKQDFLSIINERKSHRVFANAPISLLELSYLLWCTQGVKEVIGNGYATKRTVPCGGARHEFETYLSVMNVEGLPCGVYHYLPMEHALECIREENYLRAKTRTLLCDQAFAGKSAVTFMWSCVCYRAEWRYSIDAHRIILQDIGHVGENLYLACTSIDLGTCGVGAYLQQECDAFCELDGEEEFIVYTAPVGRVS